MYITGSYWGTGAQGADCIHGQYCECSVLQADCSIRVFLDGSCVQLG